MTGDERLYNQIALPLSLSLCRTPISLVNAGQVGKSMSSHRLLLGWHLEIGISSQIRYWAARRFDHR